MRFPIELHVLRVMLISYSLEKFQIYFLSLCEICIARIGSKICTYAVTANGMTLSYVAAALTPFVYVTRILYTSLLLRASVCNA